MRDILAEIVAKKRDIVAAAKRSVSLDELKSTLSCGTFRMAEHFRWRGWGLIAECKLQSPAKGRLTTSHSVTELADMPIFTRQRAQRCCPCIPIRTS